MMRKLFPLVFCAVVVLAFSGSASAHDRFCCLPDGSCVDTRPLICLSEGGDPGKPEDPPLTCSQVVCQPPDEPEPCSPGYWKNHTEVWFDQAWACSGAECDQLLADLQTRGGPGRELRHGAAALLNDRHLAEFGTLPCDED